MLVYHFFTNIATGTNFGGHSSTTAANPGVRYYNYNGIFHADEDASLSDKVVLFTNIVIPTDFANAEIALLGSYKIKMTAQAIQSDNFIDASEAFTALDAA
ncbi:MAG: hypothetical protein CVU97_01495 [Firmicutes bacterium HGW-Firmicutes-21]|nr:MAG: hypothetical protein CVU97_01495 [Firmicutes bacterium HGW-Firmicutes-21]